MGAIANCYIVVAVTLPCATVHHSKIAALVYILKNRRVGALGHLADSLVFDKS